MSKYGKYVERLAAYMKQARQVYRDLSDAQAKAKEKVDYYHIGDPSRKPLDPDDYAKGLEWNAKLIAAEGQKNAYAAALTGQARQKIREIRDELAEALEDAFSADPAKVDRETVMLLESGICTARELSRMLEKASVTTARIIGAHAEKKAAELEKDPAAINAEAKAAEFRAVATRAQEIGSVADSYLGLFDSFANAIQSATTNHDWFEGDILDSFEAETTRGFDLLG